MIATANPPSTSVTDTIRAELNLRAPSTHTLQYLRAILYPDAAKVKPTTCQANKASAAKRPVKAQKSTNAKSKPARDADPGFRIHANVDIQTSNLSPADRRKIATEAFNSTLKTLGEAAKAEKEVAKSRLNGITPSRLSHKKAPLQERSPNKEKRKDCDYQNKAKHDVPGTSWEEVVACCHSALQYLREQEASMTNTDSGKSLGTENAALMLLDRTITLGLPHQAQAQLSEIHQRSCGASEMASGPSLGRLFLGRSDAVKQSSTFNFTTSMQSQGLRLAILRGAGCIDMELLDALRVSNVGSPASITLQGLKAGRHTSEQAGQQLRTISLALAKLYSSATKSPSDKVSLDYSFELFCIALQIKFESWKHLGHKPELETEIWRPLQAAVKRMSAGNKDVAKSSALIFHYLQLFRELLKLANLVSAVPPAMIDLLANFPTSSGANAEVLMLLEERVATAKDTDLLIVRCQIANSRLKSYSEALGPTLGALQHVAHAFEVASSLSGTELERVLLHFAQLRKMAVEAMTAIEANNSKDQPSSEVQIAIIRLLYTSCRFISHQIRSRLDQTSREPAESRNVPLLTTMVKNVEAVLSTDRNAVAHRPALSTCAYDAMEHASEALEFLRTMVSSGITHSSLTSTLAQLRIRLSRALWTRFLHAADQKQSLQQQLQYLQLSLTGLSELDVEHQRAAQFGLKNERLASCYMDLGDYAAAMQAVRKAIDFSVRDGTLSDVVELLLAGPVDRAWSNQDKNCRTLAMNLNTHAKISSEHTSATEDEELFYDCLSLPAVHRVVMLERQIYTLMERDLTDHQLKFCISRVNFIMELLHHKEYHVYRLRLVSNLLQLALKRRLPSTKFPLDALCVETGPSVENQRTKTTIFLRSYEPVLRPLLPLQRMLFTGSVISQNLKAPLHQLYDVVQQCKTLDDVDKVVDSADTLMTTLESCLDYAAILGNLEQRLLIVDIVCHLIQLGHHAPKHSEMAILLQSAEIRDCLQDCSSADSAFKKAKAAMTAMATEKSDPLLEAEFALSYAEHFLNIEDMSQCLEWLQRAQHAWKSRDALCSSGRGRLREQTLLCRAARVASQVAYHRHQLLEATVYGRQSIKIASAIWMSTEKLWEVDDTPPRGHANDSQLQGLAGDFCKLDLSFQRTSRLTADMARLWPQIQLYCSAFRNAGFLAEHSGLYQDAVYFYEQALKVARKTSQYNIGRLIQTEVALIHARAGHLEKARSQDSVTHVHGGNIAVMQALTAVNQGELHLLLGDYTSSRKCLVESGRLLQVKACAPLQPGSGPKNKEKALEAPTKAKAPVRKPAPKASTRDEAAPKRPAQKAILKPNPPRTFNEVNERNLLLERKLNLAEHPQDEISRSMSTMDNVNSFVLPRKYVVEALGLVANALGMFAQDADTNVLAETAMAIPVRYRSSRKSGRVSFVQIGVSQRLIDDKRVRGKPRDVRGPHNAIKDGRDVIIQAYEILSKLKEFPQARISLDMIHTARRALTQISLLSTGLGHPLVPSSLELVLDALNPMDVALNRERIVVLSESATADKARMQSWPELGATSVANLIADSESGKAVDTSLLPPSWSIVSLGLNEARTELLVSRITTGTSPFMLRIPLSRPDISDTEVDELDFISAKTEMLRIVAQANASAHDARGSSADKAVRKAWYAERQALDQQLATLLENLENVWFGGFRGLLSGSQVNENALLKFGQSFSLTLNRHLPSRQKTCKASDAKVELHAHVLELFVTLGDPREADLEDAITDLLYFVIDILQFNGERNAYDEIDFDAMMVEVLDALYAYSDETAKAQGDKTSSHMILLLDKELQVFPWESMACLRGHATSRMPSLGAIWDRLNALRIQEKNAAGYCIPSSDGAYILNPSSDLISTQDTFGQVLEGQLTGFESIVNRPPRETEFEKILRDKSLVLYFGHGGGAQYIRGRTIRKLDKCAVTMLMGCSNAKMTECGVYEPYGMPWNYINGGSPAVVGTLWDVTDRDIDRFAMEMMVDWGLIEEDGAPQVKPKSGKKKADIPSDARRKHCATQQRGMVSLDQAVAHARDACLLRYLNGAAPVMYGIPVFLE
ncbi:separase [Exophiala viscosa]|uniref:separase n=1 Tax=Exophiala viscosa TaxID=2486360 RepID=UPI00219AEABC|nr:separase [Exophiala viscosa]